MTEAIWVKIAYLRLKTEYEQNENSNLCRNCVIRYSKQLLKYWSLFFLLYNHVSDPPKTARAVTRELT